MRTFRLNWVCILCVTTLCLFLCACGNSEPPQQDIPKLNIGQRGMGGPAANPADQEIDTTEVTEAIEDEKDSIDLETFEIEDDKLYSGINKTDPFLPLIRAENLPNDTDENGDRRRVPQTPLERFDIGQLRLSAVVESPSGNSAVVVDASGRGYVVRPGTFIGLNSGQITEIRNDRLVIVEPMGKNERGEAKVNTIELILPKPAGAF